MKEPSWNEAKRLRLGRLIRAGGLAAAYAGFEELSQSAIYNQALRLGLIESEEAPLIWSTEEEARLKVVWPEHKLDEIYAMFPGRSPAAIRKRASGLGLSRTGGRNGEHWTAEHVALASRYLDRQEAASLAGAPAPSFSSPTLASMISGASGHLSPPQDKMQRMRLHQKLRRIGIH